MIMLGNDALKNRLDDLKAEGISVFLIYHPCHGTYTIRMLKGDKNITEITDPWVGTVSDPSWTLIDRINTLAEKIRSDT